MLSSIIYDFLKTRGVKANIGDHSVWGEQEVVKQADGKWEPVKQAVRRKTETKREKVTQIRKRYLNNPNLPITEADAHLLGEQGQLEPLLTRERQFGRLEELADLALNKGVERDPKLAYLKLNFIDALPAKPPDTPQGHLAYIAMTRLVTSTFERMTDLNEYYKLQYQLKEALGKEPFHSAFDKNTWVDFKGYLDDNKTNGNYENIDEYRWDGKVAKIYVRKFINDLVYYEYNKKYLEKDKRHTNIKNDKERDLIIESLENYFLGNSRDKSNSKSSKPTWNRVSYVGEAKPHRIGPSSEAEFDSDTLKAIFGFKSALPEYGVDHYNAENHFRETGRALEDLSRILGIPKKQISLNGRLSLIIGRDYHSSYGAKAFYRSAPGGKSIHIDSNIGSGGIAHEWFHAVDNIFNEVWGGKKHGFLTAGDAPKSKIAKAAQELIHTLTRKGTYSKKSQKNPLTNLYGYAKYRDKTTRLRPYWSLPQEMSARCFETYVNDKLQSEGHKNEYLVSRDISVRKLKKKVENVSDKSNYIKSGSEYPIGKERKKINKAFDKFFAVLHETNAFEKSIAYLEFLEARRAA